LVHLIYEANSTKRIRGVVAKPSLKGIFASKVPCKKIKISIIRDYCDDGVSFHAVGKKR
jgi:hypothetical protein